MFAFCRNLGPRVHDVHEGGLGVCVENELEELLVLNAAVVEAGERLRTAANARAVVVQVGEDGQTRARSKARAALQYPLHCRARRKQNTRLLVAFRFI